MIQQIITMLQMDNFYGESEFIDIAKGKYKLHRSIGKMLKQAKREIKNIPNGRN
tara:strand:+ start:5251 stop:5412 length:162 start_codon:yes stop_codon:yes gene_type:complete